MNGNGKRSIVFVCRGNTCRSPMAKVILEELLTHKGKTIEYVVDSAARIRVSSPKAAINARTVIKEMFGKDLLGSHRAKLLTDKLAADADLILVMESWMKEGLPPEKTWGLKEFVGEDGDVEDPFGGDIREYEDCARDLTHLLDKLVSKLHRQDTID